MARPGSTPALDARALLEAAAAEDEPPARLALLLDAWRLEPASAIRELVLAASKLCQRDEVPRSPKLETDDWNSIEMTRDPVSLPRLAAAVAVEPPTEALRRLTALSRWPADPRLVDAIVSWIGHPPIQTASADAKRFWTVVFRILGESPDRARPAALAAAQPEGSGTTVIFLRGQLAKLYSALSGRRVTWASWSKLPPIVEPPLEKSLADAVAAAKASLGSAASTTGAKTKSSADREAALLDAIHADPSDDAARLVYADWLQQRGDPWGELIVLQIADSKGEGSEASRNRIAELLAAHGEARYRGLPLIWKQRYKGALRPVRFARGFAAEGEIWRPEAATPAHGDPRWGTFERLRFQTFGPAEILEYARDPAKRALRSVTNLSPEAAVLVSGNRPAHLDEIGVEVNRDPAEVVRVLAPLAEAAWLRTLLLEAQPEAQPALVEHALRDLANLPRIEISCRTWARPELWFVRIERTAAGTRLEVELLKRLQGPAAQTLALVVAAASGAASELVLRSATPVAEKSVPALLTQVFGARAKDAVWRPKG